MGGIVLDRDMSILQGAPDLQVADSTTASIINLSPGMGDHYTIGTFQAGDAYMSSPIALTDSQVDLYFDGALFLADSASLYTIQMSSRIQGQNDHYDVLIRPQANAGNTVELRSQVAGTFTIIGSLDIDVNDFVRKMATGLGISPGSTKFTFKVKDSGTDTTLEFLINDVSILSATDTTTDISGPGICGISIDTAFDSAVSIRKYVITDISSLGQVIKTYDRATDKTLIAHHARGLASTVTQLKWIQGTSGIINADNNTSRKYRIAFHERLITNAVYSFKFRLNALLAAGGDVVITARHERNTALLAGQNQVLLRLLNNTTLEIFEFIAGSTLSRASLTISSPPLNKVLELKATLSGTSATIELLDGATSLGTTSGTLTTVLGPGIQWIGIGTDAGNAEYIRFTITDTDTQVPPATSGEFAKGANLTEGGDPQNTMVRWVAPAVDTVWRQQLLRNGTLVILDEDRMRLPTAGWSDSFNDNPFGPADSYILRRFGEHGDSVDTTLTEIVAGGGPAPKIPSWGF